LIKHPKQKQQAIVLFSRAQKTSKSALALLEGLLVGDNNYVRIKNDELESTFNSIWVNALVMNLDEPHFDNKKKMTKVIRDMITAPNLNLRKMREEHEKVDFYGKVVITTNDSDCMIFEKDDRRYWARKAFPVPHADHDNEFESKMKKEIGHYMHFLLHERRMKYPKREDQTFWLPQTVTQNGSFKLLCEDNEDVLLTALKDIFELKFIEHPELQTITFRNKDVLYQLGQVQGDYAGLKISQLSEAQLRSTIRDLLGASNNGGKVSKLRIGEMDLGTEKIAKQSGKQPTRYWRLSRTQFNVDNAIFDLKK
jgi:hypothetical protein